MKNEENNNKEKLKNWFRDVATLIKENHKIAITIIAFLAVVGIVIVVSSVLANKKQPETEEVVQETTSDGYVIPDEPLEVDAYPEINSLMKKYYQAAADGDIDTIASIKTYMDDKEKIVITKKSEYIESYPTLTCYTKKGPVEDSFLVFAYYEVKLKDFDVAAPGLNAWYISKNDKGEYTITDDLQDDKLADYCKVISVQDDVVDLNNTVNVKFNEMLENNNEFARFMTELPEKLTAAVGEELAQAEVTEEPTAEIQEEEPVEEQPGQPQTVKANTVVNIRNSDSGTADKVGVARAGDEFQLVEARVNGWSKIIYDGGEAYIKTEFLDMEEPVEPEEEAATESAEAETGEESKEQPEESADKTEAEVSSSPASGKAKATTTVKLRKSSSTDSEQLGVVYGGQKVDVLEKLSNGWTKVSYGGKEGYVKSEFLE